MQRFRRHFLLAGLTLLGIAFAFRANGFQGIEFYLPLALGILLKIIFLVLVVMRKQGLPLFPILTILAGILLLLSSRPLKGEYPVVAGILLASAILLKLTGIFLLQHKK
ncbi:MAG: hypothetical protein LBG65_00055 [Puniceicoccales bacterium]|nr:hypothetical protein [Puniceicoccales bacterium]